MARARERLEAGDPGRPANLGAGRVEATSAAAASEPAAPRVKQVLVLTAGAVLAALTAALSAGAGGALDLGITLGAAILLASGLLLALVLYRDDGHALSRPARRAERAGDIVSALSAPAAVTDGRGRLLDCNEAYRAEAGTGAPMEAFATAGEAAGLGETLAAAARGEPAQARVSAAGRPMRLSATRCGGDILWICAPEEEPAEEEAGPALGEGEVAAFAAALDALDIGFALGDSQGALAYINARLAGWLGVGDAASVPELTARRLLSGESDQLKGGNGESLAKHAFHYAGDKRAALVCRPVETGSAGDATRAVRDPALFSVLFDAAPIGLAIVDPEGRLHEFNAVFRYFAPNHAPKEGELLATYVAEEDRSELTARLDSALAGEASAKPLEVHFNTQPPRTGQVFISALEHREPKAALVHLIDTTRHKSLEKQFVQAQKMQAVGQLAGGVAHDFNNLLTAIIGFCDLLLVRHGPGDQSFSDIMQIKQNANRASNLVRQLLAFSRQQTMRPKVLSVTDILADLSNLLRRLIGETIELKMFHGRDLGFVRVDQGQLEQVIINLAVNARDAMPDGGTLSIRTKAVGPEDKLVQSYSVMPADDYVLIEIADTGDGIPPEHHNKIFEPFFTTKSVGEGTGLGLSTVYGIIKQTGGYIFVESAQGEGSTFRIYLPVHTQDESDGGEAESAPKDLTGKGTILICEDEDAVRMFAARALENKGYTVLQAASSEEALETLREEAQAVDLLISDVVLPNMDGPSLVEAARGIRPEMEVVFISGYAEDVFRNNAGASAGDYAFLPKPFSLKQLAETVKDALG